MTSKAIETRLRKHANIYMICGNHEEAKAFNKIADHVLIQEKRITKLIALNEKIKLEARNHAGEARSANSTISEIYQIISGATGEPANWHGAQPVRDFVESMKTRLTVQNHRGKTFQAKFNIGDHVWYMHNNKPTEVIISAIKIFFVGTNQDRINYSAKSATHSVSWLDHTALPETLLYNSKIELLKTL